MEFGARKVVRVLASALDRSQRIVLRIPDRRIADGGRHLAAGLSDEADGGVSDRVLVIRHDV
jgi:hypothetical protein